MSCTKCEGQSNIKSENMEMSLNDDEIRIDVYENIYPHIFEIQISYCPFCSEELKKVTPPASNE